MSIDIDPIRLRVSAADPAPPESQPPATVMDADAILALIEARSADVVTGAAPARLTRPVTPAGRGMLAFAAAVIIVLLAVGAAALFRGAGDEVVDEPPVPITTVVTPSTTAAQTITTSPPGPATIQWEPVLLAGPRHLYFVRVASDGERLLAVSAESDTAEASLWTSDDGRAWELVENAGLMEGYPFHGVLTAGPEGFVVVGAGAVPPEESAGYTEVTAVASNGAGWVAVGRHELDGRVWLSDDAAAWQRTDDTAFVDATPLDVVGGGPGFVAVGYFHGLGDGGSQRAAVWVSADGRKWNLQESDTLATETRLGSVIVDPSDGSLIAFGIHSVWRSSDATDWTAIHDRSYSIWLSQPGETADAVWVGDTLVAAEGTVWTSTDRGETWERHDEDDPVFQFINALVEHQGALIAVGGDADARVNVEDTAPWVDADAPVIWIGELE